MRNAWLFSNEFKYNFLYKWSFKFRQSQRVVKLQEAKIDELRAEVTQLVKIAADRKFLLQQCKKAIETYKAKNTFDATLINRLETEVANLNLELEELRGLSPFKTGKEWLANAIKEGEANE